jgi:cytochrome c553
MISQFGRRVVLLALCSYGIVAQAQAPTAAKPDPAKGQQIAAAVCIACHGADGNSVIPANPKLNGQHAEYLVKQLVDYTKPATAKDARVNAVMTGFATTLSADDKRHVAAWYASQNPPTGTATNKDTLALGQRIYRAGIAGKEHPGMCRLSSADRRWHSIAVPAAGGTACRVHRSAAQSFRDGTRRNNLIDGADRQSHVGRGNEGGVRLHRRPALARAA